MDTLRDELTGIYKRHGVLTPAVVVDEARPTDHPLHSRFEWDDSVAGEKYRRVQAAELIRQVRIVYREDKRGDRSVRAFVSVPRDTSDTPSRSYEPIEDVLADPLRYQLLLQEAKREWKEFERKYGQLREFADIVSTAAA